MRGRRDKLGGGCQGWRRVLLCRESVINTALCVCDLREGNSPKHSSAVSCDNTLGLNEGKQK